MIKLEDIKAGNILKVLLNLDDIEEEHYARVCSVYDTFILVRYLLATEKNYENDCVYEEDGTDEVVELSSICEHYPDTNNYTDVDGIQKIAQTPYYIFRDHPPESTDESSWETASSEDQDSYVEDDFCTHDDNMPSPPPGHKEIDREWDAWEPTSRGARRFKERVDLIEQAVRQHREDKKLV